MKKQTKQSTSKDSSAAAAGNKNKKRKNINQDDSAEIYARLPTDLCNEDYFKPWFLTMDSLKRKHYPIASDEVEGDFFYFDLVPE